jgi:hypothetical protein
LPMVTVTHIWVAPGCCPFSSVSDPHPFFADPDPDPT